MRDVGLAEGRKRREGGGCKMNVMMCRTEDRRTENRGYQVL